MWKNGVKFFVEVGEIVVCDWLKIEGWENIESLNEVIVVIVSFWYVKV